MLNNILKKRNVKRKFWVRSLALCCSQTALRGPGCLLLCPAFGTVPGAQQCHSLCDLSWEAGGPHPGSEVASGLQGLAPHTSSGPMCRFLHLCWWPSQWPLRGVHGRVQGLSYRKCLAVRDTANSQEMSKISIILPKIFLMIFKRASDI